MIVTCIRSDGKSLPQAYFATGLSSPTTRYNLTVGKTYIVYAVETFSGKQFYYVCDDDFTWYPMRLPAPLFRVIDDRPSKHWVTSEQGGAILNAPAPWAQDRMFYEQLTDMNVPFANMFADMKNTIDEEAGRGKRDKTMN